MNCFSFITGSAHVCLIVITSLFNLFLHTILSYLLGTIDLKLATTLITCTRSQCTLINL